MTIHRVLVANRGEIAVRVMRTARRLGLKTVAVYSEADADMPHVSAADLAVCIGPPQVAASYLNVEAILDAAKRTGADAIHPGYGFLSENADFAEVCAQHGITFVGPPVEAIRLMGNKRAAKVRMIEAGVPCVPGYEGEDQADETLIAEAQRIGFPLMVKAAAGGGGRGMRIVHEADALPAALRSARSEAKGAFGSDELILERAVIAPRHVEIQVFGDTHGNVIHLGERDCSMQRRHQKVVEEAPSPAVDPELRAQMGEAAVRAAQACGYVGAGTVEFLLDDERNFYFLEMNTRLQVEHPVTESVTGEDLVEWQFRVADGQPLPLTQEQVELHGASIEVRLYAEDPANGFRPQTGRIEALGWPDHPDVRIDTGVGEGNEISPFYDPMIAKIISRGPDREHARRALIAA
ncbi:MAG: ATP-grasp domain-containing protein, partial [Candidatus Dadabacteria bacterium]